jgi:hypothetical protein
MVKKKKPLIRIPRKQLDKKPTKELFFMGLTKSQTQSLALGIIVTGIALFVLAAVSYKNREQITKSILPEGASTVASPTQTVMNVETTVAPTGLTTPAAGSLGGTKVTGSPTAPVNTSPTPTVIALQKPTGAVTPSPVKLAQGNKTTPITKLPNTSSKVTYTVMEGDSFAKIGEQLCHSDRAWLSIVNTNNVVYPYIINPGETYIITCL